MPKRDDIHSVLVIGAGPIVIGQACEFDYSGTQAVKALKEEGCRVILVNSNPATIMTDPGLSDATYIEPVIPSVVEKIIQKEKPDVILPTVGGQTALNTALELHKTGVLERYGVELIGASPEAIEKAEDRALFNRAMERIGREVPRNTVVSSLKEALEALEYIGLPAIIRPSFTMGGQGGGVVYNRSDFERQILRGLEASPVGSVQLDESLLGWKEFEMEVIRDKSDNAIIVCSIENIDPMGVHTGDSITVAPALTLTDKEYQEMRDDSFAVLREIGVETGGSNVQFAVHPETGRRVIIEMNPRVSRSSALASKATGFPIAKVAALLAVGYTLDEIKNDCTKITPASFEPVLDYIVTKIPRFNFEKFPESEALLGASMKAVGEVMALGRSFPESLQKAYASLETGLSGLDPLMEDKDLQDLKSAVSEFHPDRLRLCAQLFRRGVKTEEVRRLTSIDPWFLEQLKLIVETEKEIAARFPETAEDLQRVKGLGFSDRRLAELGRCSEEEVRQKRKERGVVPVYKRIDTCAAEFESQTAYLYSSYEGILPGTGFCESRPENHPHKVVILGSGPNRIGQGIEFDYVCVRGCSSLREAGYQTIMINCNPETVSTDYDTSDRLYFEPLRFETVLNILEKEAESGTLIGVLVQYGGQTPLKLATAVKEAGFPVIGTPPEVIHRSEDREAFSAFLKKLKIRQPENLIAFNDQETKEKIREIGFPVLIRPSYVLGGSNMAILESEESLEEYLKTRNIDFKEGPLLIDRFLNNAIEVDVDVLADGEEACIAGMMQHVEEAGIHSGDSACSLPPWSLSPETEASIREQSLRMARTLGVRGLMNVQFCVQDQTVYVLEVNPRASRTTPFVAKATGIPVADIGARIMCGARLKDFNLPEDQGGTKKSHYAVKDVVLPFNRFPGSDPLLGPEMKSTGEVMGLDRDFGMAFAKAYLGSQQKIPTEGRVLFSLLESDFEEAFPLIRAFRDLGFKVAATREIREKLEERELQDIEIVKHIYEGRPNILDLIINKEIQLIINPAHPGRLRNDTREVRRTAIAYNIPYTTIFSSARALVKAITALKTRELRVQSLQDLLPPVLPLP